MDEVTHPEMKARISIVVAVHLTSYVVFEVLLVGVTVRERSKEWWRKGLSLNLTEHSLRHL